MSRHSILSALAAWSLLLGVAWAEDSRQDLDAVRAAWRCRRDVRLSVAGPFAALPIPPELAARAQPGLEDLRLVWPNGTEVPYVVDRRVDREAATSWTGRLIDTRQERRRETQWTIDLDAVRSFDVVALDMPGQDFAKRLRIERSEDGRTWAVLWEDAGVFDRLWGDRIHHTRLELPVPTVARLLRVTADDRRTPPVMLSGLTVSATRRREQRLWSRVATAVLLRTQDGVSRYRFAAPAGVPFEFLTLAADDVAFQRRVVLAEAVAANGRREEHVLADGRVYRLALPDQALAGASLRLAVSAPTGGELWLDIHDGDSPPLRHLEVTVSGVERRLLFPAVNPDLVLYYANPRARAPLYDLESLSAQLRDHLEWPGAPAPAAASHEVENPRYRAAPPLPFAPTRGAPLDASRWASLRPVSVAEGEDLYSLTIAASDLARLRPDLADLRLVDDQGRQVPFVLERAAARERTALAIEPAEGARGPREGESKLSRYRLRTENDEHGEAAALPLVALDLEFSERFFRRRGLLTEPDGASAHARHPQPLWSGDLVRDADGAAPVSINLAGRPMEELELEVDEGDNVPLTLTAAHGVVDVPRIAFKAGPSQYRLLLGNPQAEPPRYDLTALRAEVLCYSARSAKAGAAQVNPAYRRRVSQYFREAPPTILLWVVLAIAVATLVFLTARIVRAGPTTPTDVPPADAAS